jgi:hypothetical protein
MTLVWSPGYAPVDEHYDNVSLLLYGNGTNGSTTITDNSPSPKTVTAVGNAQISTAQSKFGGASIAFDGTGDYLTTQSSNESNFGSSDFTIEFWIKSTKAERQDPVGWNYAFADAGWAGFVFNLSTGSMAWFENANSRISALSTGWNDGAWNHITVTRSGNNVRMFLSGSQVGSTYTTSYSYGANSSGFIIGDVFGDGGAVDGYIDDLRITKGVARYTSNFAPPTESFPDLSPTGRLALP